MSNDVVMLSKRYVSIIRGVAHGTVTAVLTVPLFAPITP